MGCIQAQNNAWRGMRSGARTPGRHRHWRPFESCDWVHLLMWLEGTRAFHHPIDERALSPLLTTPSKRNVVSVRGILFNLQSSLVFMEKECLAGSCSIYFVKSQNSKVNTCYFKKLSWSFCLVGEIWYNEFSYFLFTVSDWSAMGTRLILREAKFPHSVSVPVSLMLFFFFFNTFGLRRLHSAVVYAYSWSRPWGWRLLQARRLSLAWATQGHFIIK